MAYVRDWLPLPEARDRISTNGLDRGQASQDICHAIADQKIAVRIIVSKHDYNFAGCVLKERQVGVPVRLDPSCFDWEKSRPIGQWEGGRYPNDIDWGPREIESLEVSTRDLFAIFGAPTPKSGDTAGRTRDASTNPPNEDDEYTKWIAVNVERGTRHGRTQDLDYMRGKFPEITDTRVRALRDKHLPEEKKQPGRPRRSSNRGH